MTNIFLIGVNFCLVSPQGGMTANLFLDPPWIILFSIKRSKMKNMLDQVSFFEELIGSG